MKRHFTTLLVGTVAITMLAGCNSGQDSYSTTETPPMNSENTLLAAWVGPYEGVPAFDQMNLDELKPALEAGMEMNLAEVDKIANSSEAPTFENTIVALEGTGRDLNRIFSYYGIWSSNVSSPEFREIQAEMAPKLSDFNSKITQNSVLFDRIRKVYESDERLTEAPTRCVSSNWCMTVSLVMVPPSRERPRTAMPRSINGWPRSTRHSRTMFWPMKRAIRST